jgi:hypothetical protein
MRVSAFSLRVGLVKVAPRFSSGIDFGVRKSQERAHTIAAGFRFSLAPMKPFLRTSAVAATILAASLAACSSDKSGDCPTMTGVTDASVRTVFRPGATEDPANVLYAADIASVAGACDMDKKPPHATDANLTIVFRATRTASGGEASYAVPYFVAVTEGARILTRHNYTVTLSFEPGQTVATATETVGSVHLDPSKDKQPYDYQVLVGLQLTKAELEYNRRTAHYQP